MKTTIYIRILLVLLSMVTVLHACILLKLIPYDIAWGGRMTNDNEMYVSETISIIVNLFLIFIVYMKAHYLKLKRPQKVINILLWIFVFTFILNTVGNLLAKTTFEKSFAVLTLILAMLIWLILRGKS